MRALWLILLIAFVFIPRVSEAQTGEKWTLEKCIKYAFENNIQVRESALNAKLADRNQLQSKFNLLPSIDVSGTFSSDFGNGFNPETFNFQQGNSQSLQLQMNGNLPLFTGLQQIYNVEKTKFDYLAAKFDNENAKNTIALNIAQAYLQILLNKEIEKIAGKQKALSEDQKLTILNRIKSGALPESAIYEIDAQISRDEVAIVNAKNATDLAMLSLIQLLQLKEDKNLDIYEPEVSTEKIQDVNSMTPDGIYQFALTNQPSIMSANARVLSANSVRKISYGGFSPTLAAFANLSTGWFSLDKNNVYRDTTIFGATIPYLYSSTPVTVGGDLRTNFRQVVGLSLDVPLFSKGQKVINMQKAQLQIQLRKLQLENSKNQLYQDIEQAFANARGAQESYLANNKSLTASQKAYEATSQRYKAGMASNFDMEQGKQNLIAAESEIVKAKYTYVFRMKILDFYQGKPITLN